MTSSRWAALLALVYALWFAQGQGLLQLSAHAFSLHFFPLAAWLVPALSLLLAVLLWRGWALGWWLGMLLGGFQLYRLLGWLWASGHGKGALSWTVLGMAVLLLVFLGLLLSSSGRRRALG